MRRSIPTTHRRHRANDRRGTSVVEFAVCMPLIMLIVLGAIEATSMIFLKQSLQAAAYEGSRRSIRIDGTEVQARNVCEGVRSG